MSESAEAVRVVVRCRPLFGKEVCEKRESIVDVDIATNSVNIQNPGRKGEDGKRFTFDAVYDKDATQKGFYDESAYPIVEGVLEGFNGTIFAYGQTGCGKTHTMQGYSDPPDMRGVIPNSFEHVYEAVKADGGQKEFLVRCSYLEIYNEDVRDLLGANPKQKLELKENADRGVYVKDLTQVVVEDVQAISEVMQKGFEQRSVGSTAMNATSSRSHSIFTIVVEVNEAGEDGQEHFRAGKLNLVDLAGSERQSKTGATGDRLKEGCKINLSLSALGNVISALVDGRSKHIPYRDSKLTRLLQDSLGGNTKTLMVACVSPADYNYEETISTLRYANRAKNIKNKPTINEDPKDAMLRQYKSELEQLRKLLEEHKSGDGANADAGLQQPAGPQVASNGGIDPQNRSQLLKALQDLDGSMHRMSITTADVVTSPQHGSRARKRPDGGKADAAAGNNGSTSTPLVVEKQVPVEVKQVVEVEVESAAAKAEREALSQYNEAVVAQRDAMGADLQKKALEVANERELREAVESKLKALQGKMLGGLKGLTPVKGSDGETEHDPEVILARKNAEFRRAQHKLKSQRKKEALLEAKRKQVEAEKEAAEEAARASQEDAQARLKSHKARERKLKGKLESARAEIRDLSEEFQDERELMLNTIRDQTKQIQLLKQLTELAFPPSTISRVYEKARWDENTGLWELPRVKVGGRPASADTGVPKLPGLGDQADKENRNARKRAKRREGRRRSAEADVGDGKGEDAVAAELAGREVYSRPASRPASQCRPSSSRYGRRPSAKERPDSAARGVMIQQQQAGARPCSSAQARRGSGLGAPPESGAARRDSGGANSKETSCPTSLLAELRKRITAVAPDLRQAFDQFDENGDGVIGRSEFKRALERMGLDLPDNVGRALRKHIDKNDDKKISFGELQAFMQVGVPDPAAT